MFYRLETRNASDDHFFQSNADYKKATDLMFPDYNMAVL